MNRNQLRLASLLLIFAAFSFSPVDGIRSAIPSLKDAYSKDFLIGAALNSAQIEERNLNETKLILEQFNAITPENIMKSEVIHPGLGIYDFSMADKIIAYGQKHKMKVNGHTLVWHSQLPAFARQINSPDSFRSFFTDHINTVASRYDGKIFSWDVVNEALNEDGTMRKSIFYEKLGEDYVVEAFRLAQKASPKTELYYNDYNNEMPKKREGCIALIKKIQAAGVRIDGVGIQGHWHANKIPLKEIEESIIAYSALGLKVMITELDIEVLQRDFSGADVSKIVATDPALNPYANGVPENVLLNQATDYENLFKLFLKYKGKVTRVTFWGVNDGQSWLNNWPVRGRTNYPLLFDRAFQPKPAFDKIISLKK